METSTLERPRARVGTHPPLEEPHVVLHAAGELATVESTAQNIRLFHNKFNELGMTGIMIDIATPTNRCLLRILPTYIDFEKGVHFADDEC